MNLADNQVPEPAKAQDIFEKLWNLHLLSFTWGREQIPLPKRRVFSLFNFLPFYRILDDG
jgi:hypothetical protein